MGRDAVVSFRLRERLVRLVGALSAADLIARLLRAGDKLRYASDPCSCRQWEAGAATVRAMVLKSPACLRSNRRFGALPAKLLFPRSRLFVQKLAKRVSVPLALPQVKLSRRQLWPESVRDGSQVLTVVRLRTRRGRWRGRQGRNASRPGRHVGGRTPRKLREIVLHGIKQFLPGLAPARRLVLFSICAVLPVSLVELKFARAFAWHELPDAHAG
eukprot:scaffold1661_cov251-Pinguiococcus_pyrenoidosus.AAC.33